MQVLVRALGVLADIGDATDGRSLTELCRDHELPLSSAHRILKVLTAEGFIRRDPVTLLCFPGPRLLRMANASRHNNALAAAVRPVLEDLVRRFDDTAFVAELIQGRPVCVGMVEGRRPLHLSIQVGHELPLHAAASARALLAYEDPIRIRMLLEMYNLQPFLVGTPRTVGEVMEHLRVVRERGYDVCENELDENVWAVSVAVLGTDGRAAMSLTIAVPADRPSLRERREELIAAVREAADTLHLRGPQRVSA